MKMIRIIIITIIIFLSFTPTSANPYPPPEPTPTPIFYEPAGFCDDINDFLCGWGFWNHLGAWVATIQYLGPQPGIRPIQCVLQQGTLYSYCQEMSWLSYNPITGVNVYVAPPGPHECFESPLEYIEGKWFYVGYVYVEGLGFGEIRQPNLYSIFCIYLPTILKNG